MKNKQAVWVGTSDLMQDPALEQMASQEFATVAELAEENPEALLSSETNRRDFLKYLGFGLGAATVAASCDIPLKKAIPYVVKPDTIVPGVATYYASTFLQGGDFCPVLVKTREGRPIKVEGNSLSSITKGGTSARVQASVLSLYDTSRFDGPYEVKAGKVQYPAKSSQAGPSWKDIDAAIGGKLNANSRIRIVSNTNMSPTSKKAMAEFVAAFPNSKVVTYDAVSASALLQANEQCFGQKVVPGYSFDKAEVIVSLNADFLGTWVSPIEYAAQYASNRRITDVKKANMSRHIQIESHMSLTGSNADNRIVVKPSELGAATIALYNAVAAATGGASVSGPKLAAKKEEKIKLVAKELVAQRGRALVVSGSNNLGEQILVNYINAMLDSYGSTIDFGNASYQRQGIDKEVQDLIKEMNAGQVDAIFIMDGANPAYDLPNSDQFSKGMGKVGLKVSFAVSPNETALLCNYVTPTHHYLESWGDAEAKKGKFTLIQPTITPIFAAIKRAGTRQAEETLLRWAKSPNLPADSDQPYLEYLKANWQTTVFAQQNSFASFQSFWDNCLHNGVFEQETPVTTEFAIGGDVAAAAAKVSKPSNNELEISFFETVNMGAGQYANNPWLIEMPDPVTRAAWGNYLAIPVSWDGGWKIQAYKDLNTMESRGKADQVEVTVKGKKVTTTVVRQFGQPEGTVALGLGYGRTVTGRMGRALGEEVGVDVYPFLSVDADGNTQYYATSVSVSDKVGKEEAFACVQYHHTMGVKSKDPKSGNEINVDEKTAITLKDPFNKDGFQGGLTERSVIFQANIKELDELVERVHERRHEAAHLNEQTLYPFEEYSRDIYSQGHHWAMHVDLNACIGCGACQVACTAENNVPVVGKTEVARHHEMTWLRIDRYYYGDFETPNVVYQPMMCQHCDNAPCENVCPVAATNHSSEGLNQMTYNRCIGTRYCANNCPYKVRRFNWFDYTKADLFAFNEPHLSDESVPFGADTLTRMVLNPDVTVRSRGVIEKCSFCVQRIQEGKLTAKREGRALQDSDVRSACQTACPTGAITFGDRNNKQSEVAKRIENPLNYLVLEEVNTQSSVFYTAKINNRNEALDA